MTNDSIMSSFTKFLGYFIGFVFGMYSFELLQDSTDPGFIPEQVANPPGYDKDSYDLWLKKKGYILSQVDHDELSFGKSGTEIRKTLESHLLHNLIQVTCVVFIKKAENAYMVANTWGKHCNSILFYSNNMTKLDYIDAHFIPMKNSWQFMCECIRHLWLTQKHLQWVIFSFDDIYVIPQNLRRFLAPKDYNEPHYYGHNVYFWNVLYNSGQTSVVLSKGSILAIVNKFSNVHSCEQSGRYMNNGDYYLGKFLSELNITAGSARDHKGRERFHILKLEILLMDDSKSIVEKYTKKSVWPVKVIFISHQFIDPYYFNIISLSYKFNFGFEAINDVRLFIIPIGMECCSDTMISFPTNGNNLLVHYLIHQAKVFQSGKLGNRPKNETDNPDAWKEIAREEFGPGINLSEITAAKYFELWTQKVKEVENKKGFI